MKSLCAVLILYFFNSFSSAQEMGFQISGSGSSSSKSVRFSPYGIFDISDVSIYTGLSGGTSQYTTQPNSEVTAEEIKSVSGSFAQNFKYADLFALQYSLFSKSVDSKKVTRNGYSVGTKIYIFDFSIQYQLEKARLQQNEAFYILNRNIQDDLLIDETRHAGTVTYKFNSDHQFSVSYARYSYTQNLENYLNILNVKNVILNNGSVFYSQMSGYLDSTLDLTWVFQITNSFELETTVSQLQDFYDPKTKSTELGLFGTYQFSNWDIGAGVSTSRVEGESTTERVFEMSLGYYFDFSDSDEGE